MQMNCQILDQLERQFNYIFFSLFSEPRPCGPVRLSDHTRESLVRIHRTKHQHYNSLREKSATDWPTVQMNCSFRRWWSLESSAGEFCGVSSICDGCLSTELPNKRASGRQDDNTWRRCQDTFVVSGRSGRRKRRARQPLDALMRRGYTWGLLDPEFQARRT